MRVWLIALPPLKFSVEPELRAELEPPRTVAVPRVPVVEIVKSGLPKLGDLKNLAACGWFVFDEPTWPTADELPVVPPLLLLVVVPPLPRL